MAQRAAVALKDTIPPGNTYTLLKQFYGIRSKIAHGQVLKDHTIRFGDARMDAGKVGMYLLRQLLRSCLLAAKPWDAASLDSEMLERFGRTGGYSEAESDNEQ